MITLELNLIPAIRQQVLDLTIRLCEPLEQGLACPPNLFDDEDPELAEAWHSSLLDTQQTGIQVLKHYLQDPRMGAGPIDLEESEAERMIQALSALRLHLRSTTLKHLCDEALEAGISPELSKDPESQQLHAIYQFLAYVQSLLIHALHPDILEDLEDLEA